MNKTPKEKIDYQKDYNKKNADKIREYQKKYRVKKTRLDYGFEENQKNIKSRIYILQIGDIRLKIGASHIGSNRMCYHKTILNKIGFESNLLAYFDCRNNDLIIRIEKELKDKFCNANLGLNFNGYKKEVANIKEYKNICKYIEDKFINSGCDYDINIF